MLTASTETATAPRIGPRQPQTRDAKQSPTGFASLVDDNAAAKADSSRQPSARDTSPAKRPAAPDKPRDSGNGDDRTAPDSDPTTSSAAALATPVEGKTVSPGDKPAKTADQAVSQSAPGDTTQAPNGIASANAALVLPDAATPVPQPTAANPVAVAMPVVAPSVPLAMVAQTPAPLAIATAGIATANAAGKPASKPSDKAAETKSPAVTAVTTDASDQAATQTPEVIAEIIPEPAAGGAAKTATVAVPDGVTTQKEPAPVMPAAPQAPDTEKTIPNSPSIADGAAKPAASPQASTAETKPKPVATDSDAAPAPASPAQPHEHRAAAATSVTSTTTLDTSPVAQQPVAHTTTAAAASPTAQLTATVATAAPVPLNGLAVELASRAQSGASRFEIRLDPAELGRIDVRIDIDRDGQVKSHVTVEKPETLAMLRQDSPQLQRALNDAGLKTTDSSLQFSLGDQSQPRQNTSGGEQQTQRFIIRDEDTAPSIAPVRSYGRATAARSGVDISV